jgi:uncharacterized protein (DUF2252 family)
VESLIKLDAWPDPREPGSDTSDPYGISFDSSDSGPANESKLCNGFCPGQYLDLVDCDRKGLNRLKTAFQIENCAAALIPENLPAVEDKIRKVAGSTVFTFFRGAAAFFDYNMMCEDRNFTLNKMMMPNVYSNGDCHPENYGTLVMASNNIVKRTSTGDLVWGINDFDQSFLTPFEWDVKRGAVGFALGIKDRGWNLADVAKVSYAFIDEYVQTVMARKDCMYLNTERFTEGGDYVRRNATLIGDLIAKARAMDDPRASKQWLEDKMSIDIANNRFLYSKDRGITPLPDSVIPEFQASIDAWLYHGVAALAKYPNVGSFYKVLSVARKDGSGTGSVGLNRFYILIKGKFQEEFGQIVLEMKQEVNSVLEVFFRYSYTKSQEGKRAVNNMRNAWPYADLFYGWTTYGDDAYIVSEKSKHMMSVDISKLSKDSYTDYARFSGRALAFYHIRSRCPNWQCELDAWSAVDTEICHNIQGYLHREGPAQFVERIYRFASHEYARQNNAFELLNRFVQHRVEHGSSPLDVLLGQQRPANCLDPVDDSEAHW